MVFQREAPVKIWGWSSAKDIVVGSFQREQKKVVSNEEGYWELDFGIQPTGGPYKITIASSSKKINWEDIYVGDVWLCSGQSNMEWLLKDVENAEAEIAAADLPLLRHFKVPKTWAETPQTDLQGGVWEVASSTTARNFTAVGYFFAKEIISSEAVPIGLVNTSWGGARLEPFMSAEANRIEDIPEYLKALSEKQAKANEARIVKMKRRFKDITIPKAPSPAPTVEWQNTSIETSSWATMTLPTLWEDAGLQGFDGVIWFRKEVQLSQEEIVKIKSLQLGPIDDSDQTWINGIEVGSMQQKYNVDRTYPLRADVLKTGKNVITVRVEDTGGGGGIYGASEKMGFFGTERIKDLSGEWKMNAEALYSQSNYQYNAVPTVLYHQMIYPLINFPIKGVIWYQGESNADPKDAGVYRDQFRSLILNWREDWKQDELPFFFVQLANFMKRQEAPVESSWALLRESQAAVLELPMTGMAVAIDIGEANDIHPRNKQDVGKRLALNALHKVYNRTIPFAGPTLESASQADGVLTLIFDNAEGLKSAKAMVPGFAVSNSAGEFQWVPGKIIDNTISLDVSKIDQPMELRYAWADNPATDLYNKFDLPAAPFRVKLSQ